MDAPKPPCYDTCDPNFNEEGDECGDSGYYWACCSYEVGDSACACCPEDGGPVTQPPVDQSPSMCINGCELDSTYVNDEWCDCAECEDEDSFTCETHGDGCPTDYGDWTDCDFGDSPTQGPTHGSDTTHSPTRGLTLTRTPTHGGQDGGHGGGDTFVCIDGCEVDIAYVNDEWCDCEDFEDEDSFTCETCGHGSGCPWDLAGYYSCGDTADCQVVSPECGWCLEFGGCLWQTDECADCNCPTYPADDNDMGE
jgi:hypothetical protein